MLFSFVQATTDSFVQVDLGTARQEELVQLLVCLQVLVRPYTRSSQAEFYAQDPAGRHDVFESELSNLTQLFFKFCSNRRHYPGHIVQRL